MITILHGDALETLKTLENASVHCCVTSPPYWGLRDYNVIGQIGLERTFQEYLGKMVDVFREVKRVLRSDGTAWVNMGDCYNGSGTTGGKAAIEGTMSFRGKRNGKNIDCSGLKSKDLVGMPWRLAFALQADGWYLRQDIIWAKPNPMPESVTDRCTKAHEYLFLLSKSERYYFDSSAIQEPAICSDEAVYDNGENGLCSGESHAGKGSSTRKFRKPVPSGWNFSDGSHGNFHPEGRRNNNRNGKNAFRGQGSNRTGESGHANRTGRDLSGVGRAIMRNRRSVWTVATKPFKEAHFATFPSDLIRPCILAGCPMGGTVLDPFGGSGTTGLVAEEEGRNSVLIELNPSYVEMARRRTAQIGLFCGESNNK